MMPFWGVGPAVPTGLLLLILLPLSTRSMESSITELLQQPEIDYSDPGLDLFTPEKQYHTPSSTFPSFSSRVLTQDRGASNAKAVPPCRAAFEPTCELYPYVRYWKRFFTAEDCYVSPLAHPARSHTPLNQRKYLVFQPDVAQWNNIRMAAEVSILFAHATGRTLVLPYMPMKWLHDRSGMPNQAQTIDDVLTSFFDFNKLSEAVHIITMEEFLAVVAQTNMLKTPLPANINITEFQVKDELWKYLDSAAYGRIWNPEKMFIAFNLSTHTSGSGSNSGSSNDVDPVTGTKFNPVNADQRLQDYVHINRDHPEEKRDIVPYDKDMHSHKAIFFSCTIGEQRVLANWYTYLFFSDLQVERAYRRIARDRLRPSDSMFCSAGRAVRILHEESASLGPGAPQGRRHMSEAAEAATGHLGGLGGRRLFSEGAVDRTKVQGLDRAHPQTYGGDTNFDATYHAMHIRRHGFHVQYDETNLSAEELYDHIIPLLDPSVTRILYIATDEEDRSFFKPFLKAFELRFLSDIASRAHLAGHLSNHIQRGVVEQIICANAHTFIGTPYSTFTGYITRMRGFYRDGRYNRTFYSTKRHMYQLRDQTRIMIPLWSREFPTAHINID